MSDSATHHAGRPGDPCAMVIFGASGDLTKRKLIPALYNLAKDNLLSKEISEFATTKVDPDLWGWFAERIYYVSGEFGDPAAYARLHAQLEEIKQKHGTHGNCFYYMATAPAFFSPIVR